jgi:hypothetical protein
LTFPHPLHGPDEAISISDFEVVDQRQRCCRRVGLDPPRRTRGLFWPGDQLHSADRRAHRRRACWPYSGPRRRRIFDDNPASAALRPPARGPPASEPARPSFAAHSWAPGSRVRSVVS